MQVGRPYAIGGSAALLASGLIAATPVVSPPAVPRLSDADVRLTTSATDALEAILSGPLGGTPITSLSTLTGDLTTINDSLGLTGLLGDLDTGLSSLSGDLTDLGNLVSGIDLGGLQNIPYNVIADIVNIPYEESLALQEDAYALGPAGSVGGVAGWIPPGATTTDGGVEAVNGQDYYALGGTGSWWMESMGNTWGWDNGNWPQVDGLIHFLLPFPWTEGITTSIQSVSQSALIDGSAVDCEFECANVIGYLGGWLTHLGNVFSPTYPVTQTDTIGADSATGVVNVGPPGTEDLAIWSGQPVPFNPLLEPLQAIWQNATASPADNPIEFPNLDALLTNAELYAYNVFYDFNPLVEGSFVYWGAPTLYSVPAFLGGLVHDFSFGLIPNEFANIGDWQPYGAEPLSGYTDSLSSLLPGLEQGFQYLLTGLAGYLNPATYGAGATDALYGAGATDVAGSLGDSGTLASDLSAMLSSAGTDLSSLLGPQLGTDVSALLADLASAL